MADINELRAHFMSLKTPQKRGFITKLQEKLTKAKSPKHEEFLAECIQTYNTEVKIHNARLQPPASEKTVPDISSEHFFTAMAAMLAAPPSSPEYIKSKLVGTWERESRGKTYYYKFSEDNSLETNDIPGHDTVDGYFIVDEDSILHMEPHEVFQIKDLTFTVTGQSMIITREDSSWEYKRRD